MGFPTIGVPFGGRGGGGRCRGLRGLRRPKGEDDEDVEDSESRGDEDEEGTSPSLVQVVADERGPALAAPRDSAARRVDGAEG